MIVPNKMLRCVCVCHTDDDDEDDSEQSDDEEWDDWDWWDDEALL